METEPAPQGAAASAAPLPAQIGPYKILALLGEGGMGSVYLAEQSVPMKRRVALKLIKLGMDSKAVVARFEQERQALALMQHDGIAKVFDCGMSERGQPYFVMELVKGIPLTEFCDQRRLSLPQRIELVQQVCAAVQHAHQKGVVHRDLKPGNVLVSEDQGKVQIKIIDFGLAKAMGQKLVEATLFTEAGQVIGTPEYMAPEQADPTNQDIDTRADIYSLGVMLYEVLVGSLPFTQQELRMAGLLEMQRVLREVEPPKPSTKLSSVRDTSTAIAEQRRMSAAALYRALKNDLDWVVFKALEKDPARRYDTANALAMDLQRYLTHEPLVAGPPSAANRLRKLVRRYRGQVLAGSAVLLALIGGGIGTFVQYIRAEEKATENAKLADEKGKLAEAETKAKDDAVREKQRADAKVREFDQLKGVVLYDRAVANEKELYPARPHKVEAMERWLQDAGKLLAMRPEIEQTVRDLESRALPPTPEELETDRRSHPRFGECELLTKRVASLRRAQAIRAGSEKLVEPGLTVEQQALDAARLNELAWPRVAPPAKARKAEERTVWGEEALGLAAARLATVKAKGAPGAFQIQDTLAWALLANGQDEAARGASEEARNLAPEGRRAEYGQYLHDVQAAIEKAVETLNGAERELAELTSVVTAQHTYRFELESQRFLHDTLADLLAKLASLEAREKAEVDKRLAWAKQVQGLSLAHPNSRHSWAAVRAAIAAADDVEASKAYAGKGIELRDQDIMGLVPIGMNPVTKLWEFYELRSAWNGKGDPQAIEVPQHDLSTGAIAVKGDTGVVFVLLPGGRFTMGAQKGDPNGPNYDEQARDHESPVHEVTLAPFFLSKYELTQGQWSRLWSGDESLRLPSHFTAGFMFGGLWITMANPVERVDWSMCDGLMRQHGLTLPTEAQWEYGCRAGSTTPWLCARDELQVYANLADESAKRARAPYTCEAWTDGHTVHAPVGSFLPSAFGLHDVQGNVCEWCLDEQGSYSLGVREGDGLRLKNEGSSIRIARGGFFSQPAISARSAHRTYDAQALRSEAQGLRPARTLRLPD